MIGNITHATNRAPILPAVVDRLLDGLRDQEDRMFVLNAVNELGLNNRQTLLEHAARFTDDMSAVNRELMLRLFSEINPQEEEALFALVDQEIATWPFAIENMDRVWIIHALDNIHEGQRDTVLLHTRPFIHPHMAPAVIIEGDVPSIGVHIAEVIESVGGVIEEGRGEEAAAVLRDALQLIENHGIMEHRDQVIAELAEITDEQRANVLDQVLEQFAPGNGGGDVLAFIREVIDAAEGEGSESEEIEMDTETDDDSNDITRQ